MVSTRRSRRREPKKKNKTNAQPFTEVKETVPQASKHVSTEDTVLSSTTAPFCEDKDSSSTEIKENGTSASICSSDTSAGTNTTSEFSEINGNCSGAIPDDSIRRDHAPKHLDAQDQVRENFLWLVRSGKLITIDPLDTIPLTCVREISYSGVSKLEVAFLRSENGPGMSKGVSSAAPQPFVAQIPEDRLHYVVDYFISKGLSPENAHAIYRSKISYGIVEDADRRKALINLGEKVPALFKGYPWLVISVEWQPIEVLRAFARERKEFQRGEHIVKFTVYDIFKNLKESADEVALREGLIEGRSKNKGHLKRFADHYCGGEDTANSLTRQLAGIAAGLSWPVIVEMGVLLNTEDPDRARLLAKAVGDGCVECIDARVCKGLFTRSTFRGATTFKTVATVQDQINTLRRISFIAPQRNYKPVTKSELEGKTKKAIAARREVDKMKKKLGSHDWPADMKSLQESLLFTTTCDTEVEEHDGKSDLLPKFKALWESLFPIAAELERAIGNAETEVSTPDESSHVSSASDVEDAASAADEVSHDRRENKDQQSEQFDDSFSEGRNPEDICDDSSVKQCRGENSISSDDEEVEENELCPLKQLSVRAENQGWQDFQRNLESEDLFDFIFADPIQSLSLQELKNDMWTEFKDEKKIQEFAHFCRISLRPGCYVFVTVLADESAAFSSAFQAEGMRVMKAPFHIIPKEGSIRVTRIRGLPQSCCELAVVARTPGTHSSFSANFDQPYSLIDCNFSRKMGIIDNVPRSQNPLRGAKSRAEVRPRERHTDFVSEVIETFCSPTGTVLDVFGGALTTAISCVTSRRPCVVLEKEKYCFDLGVRRLEKLCRDRLLNPNECQRLAVEESLREDQESDS